MARRWLLPVIALALLAGYGGDLLSRQLGPSYSAQAVLVVPPSAASAGLPPGVQPLGEPSDAARLAETYAAAVTASQQLRIAVSAQTGTPVDELGAALSATSDESTSLITLAYEADTEQEVLQVLTAAAAVLTGPTPPAPVAVGTLSTLRLPEEAAPSALSATGAISTGLVGGLLLGLFLAWAVERSDPCADRTEDLRDTFPFPVTDWRRPTTGLAQRVLTRWRAAAGGQDADVSLIGVGPLQAGRLEAIAGLVREAGGQRPPVVRTSSSQSRGDDYRALAQGGDTTVLVVRSGTRVNDVRAVVGQLAQVGITPDWALLTPWRTGGAGTATAPGTVAEGQAVAARGGG